MNRIFRVLLAILMIVQMSASVSFAGPAQEAQDSRAGSVRGTYLADYGPAVEAAENLPRAHTPEEISRDVASSEPSETEKAELRHLIAQTATAGKTGQIVLVLGHHLTLWNKNSRGQWSLTYWTYNGYGRNGLSGDRTLGDKTTPIGSFPLLFAFGTEENPDTAMEYRQIGPRSWWSGKRDQTFNTWVESEDRIPGEHLADYYQYKYAMAIGFNISPPDFTRGCAIFLHMKSEEEWDTSGCVSVTEEAMKELFKNIRNGAYIIIVPEAEGILNY